MTRSDPTIHAPLGGMDVEIGPDVARCAFLEHVRAKGRAARVAYGPLIDADAIVAMLDDRAVVRHPTTLVFDATPLEANEFAFAQPVGFHAGDGYALCVHPHFRERRDAWPRLVAYHVPVINYGAIVDAEIAETFGATLLGEDEATYYSAVCRLADEVLAAEAPPH